MVLSFDLGDCFMAHNGFDFVLQSPSAKGAAVVSGTLGKNVAFEIVSRKLHNGKAYLCLNTRGVGRIWAQEDHVRRATQAHHADAPGAEFADA